jgi:hypothetical protein
MINIALKRITDKLPRDLRNDILGYVQSIINSQEEIFRENGIKYSKDLAEKFIFLVGIRRIIQTVDSQFWLLNNSFSILKDLNVSSVKIGSQSINSKSQYYKDLIKLRLSLLKFVQKHKLSDILLTYNLGEILRQLHK